MKLSPKAQTFAATTVLVVLALLSLTEGEMSLSIAGLFGQGDTLGDQTSRSVFYLIRLPRTLAALLAGAALAMAGAISQGVFRNPLASPSVLGIESGGLVAGAICIALLPPEWIGTALPFATLLGCAVLALILVVLSLRVFTATIHILLVGIALGASGAALTNLILALASRDSYRIPTYVNWTLGSFAGANWELIGIASILIIGGTVAAVRVSHRLDVLALGESVAASLGVGIRSLQAQSIVAIALLLGGALSLGGALPFVGLIVPHVARQFGGPRHARLVLNSLAVGAVLAVTADLVGRTAIRPEEIPVGVITALIGTPVFVAIAAGQRQQGVRHAA